MVSPVDNYTNSLLVTTLLGNTTSSQNNTDLTTQLVAGSNEVLDSAAISAEAKALGNSSVIPSTSGNSSAGTTGTQFTYTDPSITENGMLVSALFSNSTGKTQSSFVSSLSDTQLSNMLYIQNLPQLAKYAEKLLQEQNSTSSSSTNQTASGT